MIDNSGTMSPIKDSQPSKQGRVLPPRTRRTPKLTVALDLDETLVHSSLVVTTEADHVLEFGGGESQCRLYVHYRPGLREFLTRAAENFELVLFTASEAIYADRVLANIDPQRTLLKHRLYRDSCTLVDGIFVKDLRILGRELNQVVLVDNSVDAFSLQLNNGIPICSWFSDQQDQELFFLYNALCKLDQLEDVRPLIAQLNKSLINVGAV